ncbi:hypothetical protein [Terribacillus sp. DMT04]|uniref:AbiTii domain-containing protein n=1 Tax=Terribacillus sp. DMT04 TaxID=2850441 RepID=UPI001C2C7882|nr:hypothetical protein [Terribacillus sp. DMT04]QXE01919.1 hypothetical protein KS242_01260 [Terribacillus sp. DMT04]
MARSQLLKDIVSGKENIENILLRLKVILSDLDSKPIINWVNGELEGFKGEHDILPQYRILKGSPTGTFVVNYNVQYTDSPVPLRTLIPDDETYDSITTLEMTDSLSAIQNILNGENRDNYAKVISTDFCHHISRGELQIARMRIRVGSNQLDGIISKVKSKLIDIIMELENQFDNLDELDIQEQVEEDTSKKDNAVYNIENIIYDGSLKVGDKNKVVKSRLGHFFGGGKD